MIELTNLIPHYSQQRDFNGNAKKMTLEFEEPFTVFDGEKDVEITEIVLLFSYGIVEAISLKSKFNIEVSFNYVIPDGDEFNTCTWSNQTLSHIREFFKQNDKTFNFRLKRKQIISNYMITQKIYNDVNNAIAYGYLIYK